MEYRFSTWMCDLSAKYGENPAITCGTTLSFRELWDAARRCAILLTEFGVHKGDKVVLWAYNGVDWIIAFFGIAMAGGVATLMNYGLNEDDVSQLTKMTGASWGIIGENKISAQNPEAAAQALLRGGVAENHVLRLCDLFAAATDSSKPVEEMAFRENDGQVRPKDTRMIIFTTGTTSMPKGVQLSSWSVLHDAEATLAVLKDDMTDSMCDALPLFHSFGMMVMFIWLSAGKQVHLMKRIKAESVAGEIFERKISGLATVGAIYNGMMRLSEFEEKQAGLLKTCLVGGGFTTPTEMLRMENLLHGGKMLIAYGQTECSPMISVNKGSDAVEKRAVSVGHVIPGVDVRIWREDSAFLSQGGIGEIVVKGPVVMNGYLGLPANQQPFDAEGWLHTGDLGFINADGLLVIAGRIKDIIIRGGENIAPKEIETAILENDAIREAKVMGAPHPIWGESVEACVVTEDGMPNEESLKTFLRNRLSSYKIPSHFFSYSAFPLSTNGKLDQRELKASMLEKLRTVYVANALDEGLKILSVRVGNRPYTITPVCDMVQGLAGALGFSERQIHRIRLASEEMITERITNAYDTRGEIALEIILMPEWLRIRFTDTGKPYRLDCENASLSARIILANVDAYSSAEAGGKLVESNLDWQYAEGFDVNSYLMRNGEEGKT